MSSVRKWFVFALPIACFGLLSIGSASAEMPLADMGLSSLEVVPDSVALDVRGKGFSLAYGKSWASVPGAGSENGYLAISKTRNSEAGGANESYASKSYRKHGHKYKLTVVAGGFSRAYAK